MSALEKGAFFFEYLVLLPDDIIVEKSGLSLKEVKKLGLARRKSI